MDTAKPTVLVRNFESLKVREFESKPNPVKYAVIDNATDVRWKPFVKDWDGWEARYDNDTEQGKRTTRKLDGLDDGTIFDLKQALSYIGLVRIIAEAFQFDPTRFFLDFTMHGGGIHVTAPGGWLNCHLDYDQHPHIPDYRRAVNLIAFLHEEWRPEWGGQFYLADRLGSPRIVLDPLPGRIVMFETSDASYHGVLPIKGPQDRVSLALYYLAPSGPQHSRLRALFMPNRGKG